MSKILLPKFERFRAIGRHIPKWSDPDSLYFRLPEHYKQRHRDFLNTVPKPVHYKPSEKPYIVDHVHGVKKIVRDTPLVILYPTQSKLGMWGGEGIIPGYRRPHQTGYKRPQYLSTKLWRPRILKMIFYSEILNQYYALTCTRRALDLIEQAKGFDFYILKEHEVDLKSDIGMQLKREMLIRLAKKDTDLYPDDKEKRDTIYNRYKEFLLPLEEAEWVGLKPWEAMKKQKDIEQQKLKESTKPLKELFAQETLKKLENNELSLEQIEKKLSGDVEKKSLFRGFIAETFGGSKKKN